MMGVASTAVRVREVAVMSRRTLLMGLAAGGAALALVAVVALLFVTFSSRQDDYGFPGARPLPAGAKRVTVSGVVTEEAVRPQDAIDDFARLAGEVPDPAARRTWVLQVERPTPARLRHIQPTQGVWCHFNDGRAVSRLRRGESVRVTGTLTGPDNGVMTLVLDDCTID
jgi:hypothetical protein